MSPLELKPGDSSKPLPRMTVVSDQQIPEPSPVQFQGPINSPTPTDQSQTPTIPTPSGGVRSEILEFFLKILAARHIALIAVLGGIGLTFLALRDPNLYQLIAIGIYGVLVALPAFAMAVWG
jgi:hypothetical protein